MNNDQTKGFNRKIKVEVYRIQAIEMFTFQTSSFHLQQPNRRESAWFTLAISHRIIGNRKILIRRKISSHSIGTEIRTTRVSKISKYRNLSGKFVPEIDVLAAPTNTTGNLDRGKNGRVSRDRMSPLHAHSKSSTLTFRPPHFRRIIPADSFFLYFSCQSD